MSAPGCEPAKFDEPHAFQLARTFAALSCPGVNFEMQIQETLSSIAIVGTHNLWKIISAGSGDKP
jgi:hypothetical protein